MNPTAIVTPAVAVVLILNAVVATLLQMTKGNLGPLKVPPTWGPWLVSVGGFLGGAAANLGPLVASPGFAFTWAVILSAVLAGWAVFLGGAGASAGVNHVHFGGLKDRLAMGLALRSAKKPASTVPPKAA